MNRYEKILKFKKIAAGVPGDTIFLDENNQEVTSQNLADQISLIAANTAVNKLVNKNISDPNLFSRLFKLKSFGEDINRVAIFIGITDKDEEVINTTSTVDSEKLLGQKASLIAEKNIKLIRIIIHKDDLYDKERENYPDKNFIKKYIKEILIHELVHASELIKTLDPEKDKYKYKRTKKLDELSNIQEQNNPLSDFYYTTREEIAAYLKQITAELEHELTDADFRLLSVDEILERSLTLPHILKKLSPGEDIRTPFGKLNRRKNIARKKFLSALYSWIMEKKNI